MKLCWDNLEKMRYRPDRGEWQDKWKHLYSYKENCKNCNEPFLASKDSKGKFCNISCKTLSKETKKKISKALSSKNHPFYGKKRPDFSGKNHPAKRHEVQKKMSESHKGKKHSPETKQKMSNIKRGKIFSEKHKQKLSKNHADFSGINNPNWKDGISCEPYCGVWSDKEFKESIKERDGYQCLNPICSKNNERLCLHHINYIKKDCSPFNLITLCNSCNSRANANREWHKAWYKIIIHQRYKKWQT